MALLSELRRCGDIARTAHLIDRGVTRREIERSLTTGRVLRPARGWVALRGADPELLFAARHHVVLSCVTQARRLKLWTMDEPEVPHVAAPNAGAKVRDAGMRVHWTRPLILRPPFLLVDPIDNVLAHVAECQPREAAMVIWESALNRCLVDVLELQTLPLRRKAQEILSACTPFSDSGLESIVCSRLRWLPIPVRQQVVVGGRRVDVLIGERLIVQIDGATHAGAQRTSDIAFDAALIKLGYRVIRLSYEQVIYRWEEAQELILAAISLGEHIARR